MTTLRFTTIALALALSACGDSHTSDDGGARHDAGTMDAGTHDAGSTRDAGAPRDAALADARAEDAGTIVDAGVDAGSPRDAGPAQDAGPLCEGMTAGRCDATGVSCMCCPAGGPLNNCLCTTSCTMDSDCTDPTRPHCNRPMGGPGGSGPGICTPNSFTCLWGAVCASPDTPIATPKGERAIADLMQGDLVYSMNHGSLIAVPLARVARTAVTDHAVVHVELATGRVLEISAGHPTADGRTFAELAPGQTLDGVAIRSVETIPYRHRFTHDILPASDTGTYVAGGVLIGSTLMER